MSSNCCNWLLCAVVVSYFTGCVSGLHFKAGWCGYVQAIIKHHEKNGLQPSVISSSVLVLSLIDYAPHEMSSVDTSYSAAQSCLDADIECTSILCANSPLSDLPGVIVWDPITQYPELFCEYQCTFHCCEPNCGKLMKFLTWQDGSHARYNPRCIYGSSGCVLLISRIYRCPDGHLLTSSDPCFLQKFKKRSIIPFFLLHKSGVTRELQYFIFHHASLGTSFADIHKLLLWSIQASWARDMLAIHSKSDGLDIPSSVISTDLIINTFIITYNELKSYIYSEVYKLQENSEMISCDHTFKFPSHIGIYRNGKWIPQYDSLFIMQNEMGKVIFWQLTMGTAYASVRDGIELLRHKKNVKMISIDNCCMWRKLLKQSLGDDVEVKLDLFHAVKRVSTALSKKHSHFYQALQDFRLVFRTAGDSGLQRKKATPPSEILLKNINAFVSKWSNISGSNGNNSIITLAVLKEISNLKVHITKGCLSDIPAHFGTSKNENMHKLLNSRFSGNRLGVELAVALLAVFFHNWNQRNGKHCISNICQYLLSQIDQQIDEQTSSTLPKFGIGVSSQRSYLFDNVKTSVKNEGSAWDVLQRIGKQAMSPNSESLSEDMVYSVLHDAFSLLNSEEVLNSMSDVHAHVTRILPSSIGNAITRSQYHGLPADSVSRLNNVLQSFAMQKHEVPMNGDCLFSSIILYLNKTFQLNSESNLIDQLASLHKAVMFC